MDYVSHKIITIHGDMLFGCSPKAALEGTAVAMNCWHATKSGWWGNQQELIIPNAAIRYIEVGNFEVFGELEPLPELSPA